MNGSEVLKLHRIGHRSTLDDLKTGTPSMFTLRAIQSKLVDNAGHCARIFKIPVSMPKCAYFPPHLSAVCTVLVVCNQVRASFGRRCPCRRRMSNSSFNDVRVHLFRVAQLRCHFFTQIRLIFCVILISGTCF